MNSPTPQKQVLRAAAFAIQKWKTGWDISAIWALQDAFNQLPDDDRASLTAWANAEIEKQAAVRAQRRIDYEERQDAMEVMP